MTRLSVNINKVATLRNARGGDVPNVVKVALDCEDFGEALEAALRNWRGEPAEKQHEHEGKLVCTIQVCESGAKGIQARIDDLPDKSEITYSNYKSFQQTVSALQADYNALPDKSQVSAAKLTAAAEQIQFFAAIDSVKTQIADLPTAVEITENPEAHRSKVEAAKTAYEALGISGQLYLKAAGSRPTLRSG